jgi:molybdate-binding protein/DNA-binding XRE family transcriptional regulator
VQHSSNIERTRNRTDLTWAKSAGPTRASTTATTYYTITPACGRLQQSDPARPSALVIVAHFDKSASCLAIATILPYRDTIMAETLSRNLIRAYRQQRGWSQAELANRAGISRAAVSAIEMDRLVPSVAAALALAAAFGCKVEDLFGLATTGQPEPCWAWPPASTPCRFWLAQVRERLLRYPAEPTAVGVVAHDGVQHMDAIQNCGEVNPATTLVLACCDPAAGLLATEYARTSGFRMIVLPRPSGQALSLLNQGLVHAAGVHFATDEEPDGNAKAVRDTVGGGHCLLRVARWQEGLSVAASARIASVGDALRSRLRWVGREPGSAARRCLDELLDGRAAPRRMAHDHRGVADAVRGGWADVGVCHRLACEEAGLQFLGVRRELFDLCFPASEEGDPRIAALVEVVRSPSYRRLLGDLPGYDTADTGDLGTLDAGVGGGS